MRFAPNKDERKRMEGEAVQAMLHGKTQTWTLRWLERRYPRLRALTLAKLDTCLAEANRIKKAGYVCPQGCEFCGEKA